MFLAKFLLFYHFGIPKPEDIHQFRWNAMIKWVETRKKLAEPEVFPD